MLVLSRKPGETIMIGDQIELIVLSTEGDVVKLGVVAPKEQQILRKEIYVALKESNLEASNPTANLNKLRDFFKKK
ncbi:carbon storage regulator CsrA [Paenibacillus sp. SYP-B3998]|uniref:Translational regulator CsrA n=1 Tax=Paenibacillus sp. SYP-B3998 TaxID=2678564 RepID=A0A6G4A3E5_9BACL|nr:carbon storage regulator CsrA [Paenibacillus sp. SYP-B3998]NEW08850.1 carbon storage regulator CsrA [Paenibacillus sp. SYP-B3998]